MLKGTLSSDGILTYRIVDVNPITTSDNSNTPKTYQRRYNSPPLIQVIIGIILSSISIQRITNKEQMEMRIAVGADHAGYTKRIQSVTKAISNNKVNLVCKVSQLVKLFKVNQ